VTSEKLEIVQTEYQAGQVAFESGRYAQAVQSLETATGLVDRNSRLGGEVQMWLVTAYEASGNTEKAIEPLPQAHPPSPPRNPPASKALAVHSRSSQTHYPS
jgi:lipopolysaccharide biosynthesis regulator YciM